MNIVTNEMIGKMIIILRLVSELLFVNVWKVELSVFGCFYNVDWKLVKTEMIRKMVKICELVSEWLFVEIIKKSKFVEGYGEWPIRVWLFFWSGQKIG